MPNPRKIVFGSDEYFELLREHPQTAKWLSLGRQVSFILGNRIIVIVEK